ncbi:MAG: DMT family transporter [Victivallales bacterium]|nr:DMT family transporter [Victivallales bacterium]
MQEKTLNERIKKNKAVMFGYFSLIIGVFLFSSAEVFSKLVTMTKPYPSAYWISSVRFILAGIVFIPSFFARPCFKLRDLFVIFFLSIFSVTLAMTCFFQVALMPEYNLNASIAAIIFCANPIFAIFWSPLVNRRFGVTGFRRLSGAFIALVGVAIAAFSAIEGFGSSFEGAFLMLGASVLFAVQIPYSKKYILEYGSMKYLGMLFLMGGFVSAVVAYFISGIPEPAQFSNNLWVMLGYSLITCALGHYLYSHGFKNVNTSKGAQISFLKPLLAPVIALYVLGTPIYDSVIIGVIIILAGINWAIVQKK